MSEETTVVESNEQRIEGIKAQLREEPEAAEPAPERKAPAYIDAAKKAKVELAKAKAEKADFERKLTETSKAAKELEELRAKFATSPLEALQGMGVDFEKTLKSFVDEGTPEALQRKELEQMRAEIAAANKKLADRDEAERRYHEEQQARQREATATKAKTEFVQEVLANAEQFPNIAAEYDEAQLAEAAVQAMRSAYRALRDTYPHASEEQLAEVMRGYSNEQIAQALEDQAAQLVQQREARRAALSGKSRKETVKAPSKTLSKNLTSSKSPARDISELSLAERLEFAKKAL